MAPIGPATRLDGLAGCWTCPCCSLLLPVALRLGLVICFFRLLRMSSSPPLSSSRPLGDGVRLRAAFGRNSGRSRVLPRLMNLSGCLSAGLLVSLVFVSLLGALSEDCES